MAEIPIELLVLMPLAIAAGVDLYLTLLLIGAAPTTGLWPTPLPGALGDLDPPGVLITVGTFYLLEFAAERFAGSSLAWNAFHAIIRPVSAALLTLLLLDGQSVTVVVSGCLVGGLLASVSHGVRTGATALRWLRPGSDPSALVVSLAEDAVVLALVILTLDAPRWAFGIALVIVAVAAPLGPSNLRAFRFTVRLAIGRVFSGLSQRRWLVADELPDWATSTLEDEEPVRPGDVRASPTGAHRLPGAPRFTTGWVVIRGGPPLFVFRRWGRTRRIDLSALKATRLEEGTLYRRIELREEGTIAFVLFGARGPRAEALRVEFGLPS